METKDGRRLVGILIPNENAEMIKDTILKDARKLVDSGACPDAMSEKQPEMSEKQPESSTSVVHVKPTPSVTSAAGGAPKQTRSVEEEEEEEEEEAVLVAESDDDDVNVEAPCTDATKALEVAVTCADMTDVTHEPIARERSDQLDAKQADDCEMPSAHAAEGKKAAVDVSAVVAAEDCGDETEDESDVEDGCEQAGQTAKEVRVAKDATAAINAAASSAATGGEATAGERHETAAASCGTAKCRLRDSILSNSDTPQKDVDAHHPTGDKRALDDDEITGKPDPSNTKASVSEKKSLKARVPAPEDDGSGDEGVVGDERAIQDAQAKMQLLQRPENDKGQEGDLSKSKTAELEASGLWELDDDAEAFFAQGLKIMEEARKKDECVRRRYNPSQAKHSKEKKKKTNGSAASRSGRTRKKTDRFADGKMKGQIYVIDDDGTENDSEEDGDQSSAGQKSKGEGGCKSAREGGESEGQARVRKPRVPKQRQVASAVMVDRALKEDADARKVRFNDAGKLKLKELANSFLGGLLGRPELCGKMSERAVKCAIRSWIPDLGGAGELMRCACVCMCARVCSCVRVC